ncbi:MAG TPA: class I SAM-dependent methyltransferase [Gammaproteobacteria bacterium]
MKRPITRSLVFGLLAGMAGGGATAGGVLLGFGTFESAWPVFVTCGILAALLHNTRQSILGMVDNRTHTLSNRIDRIRRDVGDIHGLVRLGPYTGELPLPMGGGWALTGDSAALLAREALARKPETVLELGSGASTLILGQILRKNGRGRLLSIDHDGAWADETRRHVKLLGLEDIVSVVDAPLNKQALGEQMVEWYDIPKSAIEQLGSIDLLLVDGPPQKHGSDVQARYPALPFLRGSLSKDALVFVDDANRDSEKKMVERWLAEDDRWKPRWFDTVDGVCLLSRGP